MAKLVLGLTDEDSEYFIPNDRTVDTDEKTIAVNSYNLYKDDTSIEKATLEWEFFDTPLVTSILDQIDELTVKPHLKIISIVDTQGLAPTLIEKKIDLEFINLLPDFSKDYDTLSIEDFEGMVTSGHGFGCIEYNINKATEIAGINDINGIMYAKETNDLSSLAPADDYNPAVVPAMTINFELVRPSKLTTTVRDDTIMWYNENKEALDKLGYTLDNPKIKAGKILLARMTTPVGDAYNTIHMYSKVCRTTIIRD